MSLFLILILAILSYTRCSMAFKSCPNCGNFSVPYPLSTGPNCGDQMYKIQCNSHSSTLWFNALYNSSYLITSINPETQRLIIGPPGFAKDTCTAADYKSQGIELDQSLPFNITGSNTVLVMNCSSEMLGLSLNCSSTSICHNYIRDNAVANAFCGSFPICCWYKAGGSINEYKIRVREGRCAAYQSFVNLDTDLPVSQWPEPGVEIEWALPQEPICKLSSDCQDLLNSICLKDPASAARRKCFCKSGFQWDPINAICQRVKCSNGSRGCKNRKSRTSVIGGLLATVIAFLLGGVIVIIIVVYLQRHRNKREDEVSLTRAEKDMFRANNNGSGRLFRIFNAKEITKATNSFSKDNLLGSGGFGEVFKAILDDGTITAVKRAKLGNIKGIDQILNEVRILSQVNHRFLVKLLGCCVELKQPLLVYEYVSNGTLFDHLHRVHLSPLKWKDRLNIAHQTAQALAYLHLLAEPPIYHRDIKSSNILLDEKLDVKVSDFGISRLAVNDATHITTCAQGTLGYLDPEYYLSFQLTDKSDVYSFGVVLVEMLTSKKAVDFNREEEDVNLVVYFVKVVEEERLMDAIDSVLKKGASKVELDSMKDLGFLAATCLQERRQNRPSMKEVADVIERITTTLVTYEVQSSI